MKSYLRLHQYLLLSTTFQDNKILNQFISTHQMNFSSGMCYQKHWILGVTKSLIWHAASLFSKSESPGPNWSGYMQRISHGDHLLSAANTLWPIIDLKPTDYTCIYSTLLFVINQCKKLNITTPSTTFDQPLWLKATEIAIEK